MSYRSKHRGASSRGRYVLFGAVAVALLGAGVAYADPFGGPKPAPLSLPVSTPTPSVTPSASASPTAAPPAKTITLTGVGDVIMGTLPGSMPPDNGAGYYDDVKAKLASDLVMGNLEEALSVDTGNVKCGAQSTGCFAFHQPTSFANVLRDGGFDLVNLANNHSLDMGQAGLVSTRNALTKAGVKWTGAPGMITVVDVKGVKVAVIGASPWNGSQSVIDIKSTAALVRAAKGQADLVVVQMQAGAEGADKDHVRPGTEYFLGENRGDELAFSHAMIDAGADLIVGHGPHVMRGMQFYKGKLIAFSLGNFTGYKTLGASGYSGVGGILRVTLTAGGDYVSGSLTATEMVRGGLPALDPDKRALGFVRGLSRDDFGATAAVIGSDGKITPPAV
jgi:Bacterial capsule synthesis protein PGA_cap